MGYRRPSDWMAAGAGAVPDFPEEFEDALLAWTLYKAHGHQDDTELAAMAREDNRRPRSTATSSSIALQILDTLLLETPVSQPRAHTTSTFRVEAPVT
jgi:hypothetical protein